MAEAVIENDGVIEKFTGDGLMAVYGVPVPRTTETERADDVRRSFETALSMCARLKELNASAASENMPLTECRIGIHSGLVSAGTVGTATRTNYTILGQPANLAARLEGYGKDDPEIANGPDGTPLTCRILVSETAADFLRDKVDQSAGQILEILDRNDSSTLESAGTVEAKMPKRGIEARLKNKR